MSSTELVQRWREGDPSAGDALVNLYRSQLLSIVARRMERARDLTNTPEDIVQSALASFLRQLRQRDYHIPTEAHLFRLVLSIALNLVRNAFRYEFAIQRDRTRLQAVEEWHRFPSLDDVAGRIEHQDFVQHLMQHLEGRDQTVLDMKLQGYSELEIASTIRVNERTVRRIWSRIRSRIAARVEEYCAC